MNTRLKKEQYPEFLSLAEKLSDKIANGPTHFISRKKLKETNGFYYNEENKIHYFQTFHSLAAQVLPKYSFDDILAKELKRGKLAGEEMYTNVKVAVELYNLVYRLENQDVDMYYKAIRVYENSRIDSLADLEAGLEIYKKYQKLMKKKLDWEDSIKLATHYLEYDIITSVEGLPKRYVILDPEALLEDRNENIARFMISFYQWTIRNSHDINFMFLKNNKIIVPYIRGVMQKELPIGDLLNLND